MFWNRFLTLRYSCLQVLYSNPVISAHIISQMTSLADDLLKTRSILDLNSVVDNLSNEILNKQKELQGMVGSQYNQFIRSADKIIDMKNRSNELLSSLTDFVSFNSKVITNFDKLVDQSFRSSGNVSAPTLQDQGKRSLRQSFDFISSAARYHFIIDVAKNELRRNLCGRKVRYYRDDVWVCWGE